MEYVIIGNGVACAGAIEGIRKSDPSGPITVVSSEPYRVYGRPLIAHFLSGRLEEAGIYYKPFGFYEENGVRLLLGKTARSIDSKKKRVILDSGEAIPFDRLLIATGGVPFVPKIKGSDGPGVYAFTTIDDAKRLDALIGQVEKVTVLGGGLIGLKVAESLHDRGMQVTVVELADRILSAAFDKTAGEIIAGRLREVGIEVVLDNSIREIRRVKGRIRSAVLNDGRKKECGAVVIAIGVVPNTAFLAGSDVKVHRGVLTDEYMRTNLPGIFAAGDVAQAPDMLAGERRVAPIWPNAYLQGIYAGRNMAGDEKLYRGGFAMNSIEFYGIPTVSMGIANPPESHEVESYEVVFRLDEEKRVYKKLVLRDNVLVGAVLVGRIDRAGIYTGFILNRMPVGDFKDEMLRDDFGFARIPAETRKRALAARF